MDITWLGHACFRLRSRDVAVVTDPFSGEGWGHQAIATAGNIVTVSHQDPHHSYAEGVTGNPRVVSGPGEYEIGGVMITGIPGLRRTGQGEPPGKNTMYLLLIEDIRVCHLGDIAGPLTSEQLIVAQDAEILLVPVGGNCTINGAESAKVVAQIEPRVIIPMHYATPETAGHLDLEGLDRFRREMGVSELPAQNRFSVTANSLPLEPTVVILEQRR